MQVHDGGTRGAAGGPEESKPEALWLPGTRSPASEDQPESPGADHSLEDTGRERLELAGEDDGGATGSGWSTDANFTTHIKTELACTLYMLISILR